MLNQQVIEGSWKELRGKLKEKWGQLTNDELDQASGNVERLIGLVQRKSGESREAVSNFMEQTVQQCQSQWDRTGQMLRSYAESTMEGAEQWGAEASKRLQAGYVQSERFVRRHPLETLAVCLGVGVVAGVVATMLTSSSHSGYRR